MRQTHRRQAGSSISRISQPASCVLHMESETSRRRMHTCHARIRHIISHRRLAAASRRIACVWTHSELAVSHMDTARGHHTRVLVRKATARVYVCVGICAPRASLCIASGRGCGRNSFTSPRSCALRNGWGTRWSSRTCSPPRSDWTAACTCFTAMPPSKRLVNRSKRASYSAPPNLSSGGSAFIPTPPDGPPGP